MEFENVPIPKHLRKSLCWSSQQSDLHHRDALGAELSEPHRALEGGREER